MKKKNYKKGKLVTLEGISGIGKTFYFNILKKELDMHGFIFSDEINDKRHDGINLDIFKILTKNNSRFFDNGNPKLETLLICGKQINDEETFIKPFINQGKTIICDRGYDTISIIEGIIYSQKYKCSQKESIQNMYNSISKLCLVPDITILFTGNFEKSIKRAEIRDKQKYTIKEMKILKSSYYWFKRILPKLENRKVYILNVDKMSTKEIVKEIKKILYL